MSTSTTAGYGVGGYGDGPYGDPIEDEEPTPEPEPEPEPEPGAEPSPEPEPEPEPEPQVTIDIFDAWRVHSNNSHADLAVTWTVSDTGGQLTNLLIHVRRESGGTVARVIEESTSGESSTGLWEYRVHKGRNHAYTVTLIAETSDGRTATQSKLLPVTS